MNKVKILKTKQSQIQYLIRDGLLDGMRVIAPINRWLRFDPTNKKGLVIKGGTRIRLANGDFMAFDEDTKINLTSQLSSVGADYFLYLNNDGSFTASTVALTSGVKIGRFHTLCANVGTDTMIAPSSGLASGDNYLVKSYNQETDADFYNFYNKKITALTSQDYYDVATMAHPLSGFSAGDILPESVFCLSFHPETLVEDAMVYDKDMDIAVDVYLQSGKGLNTRSKFNATHTVLRQAGNHMEDMRMVGKRLLSDAEFTSAAIGSNEKTNIVGSSDKTTVGGHSDTAGRRMISAIGVEEMCGYLWQWTSELVGAKSTEPNNTWADPDGHGSFGQEYWMPYVLIAGGSWFDGPACGSRSRTSPNVRSHVAGNIGGRGSSHVTRGI